MSIAVMTAVWKLNLPDDEKIILLKLADCADDDGMNAFPSVNRIAVECGTSERTVQRRLRSLEEKGLIRIVREATATMSRTYQVCTDRGDKLTPQDYKKRGDKLTPGVVRDTPGVTPVTRRGDTSDTLNVIETSVEPSLSFVGRSAKEMKRHENRIEGLWRDAMGNAAPGRLSARQVAEAVSVEQEAAECGLTGILEAAISITATKGLDRNHWRYMLGVARQQIADASTPSAASFTVDPRRRTNLAGKYAGLIQT